MSLVRTLSPSLEHAIFASRAGLTFRIPLLPRVLKGERVKHAQGLVPSNDRWRNRRNHMRNSILIAFAGVAAAFLGCRAQATTYYVDVDHGSDTNSGTAFTSAWAHLPGTVGTNGFAWVTL